MERTLIEVIGHCHECVVKLVGDRGGECAVCSGRNDRESILS